MGLSRQNGSIDEETVFPRGETEIGGQNQVKKQLPGWAVLLIITLVAGLALGGTNALTKDPIAQQALIKAENARKAALPDAASFEELPLAEGASVDWVYAGLKDGAPIGYVAQKTVNGFGGKVEVIAGVDTVNAPDTFKIGGITVGGSDFSETAGLGARAKEPAFTNQFPGKVYPISYIKAGGEATESTVDALTSATITTTAVVNGVNDIVKYVKADVMGIAGVEMPAKPADGVFSASEKGFRGPVYVEAAFDGTGKVTYIKVGDESFAEDIGVGVIEPDFMIQFIGKQMPLEVADIDVIAGATISSTAVVKALNNAYAIAGGAEIVVPETPTMPEKPAEGVFSASADGFRGPVYVEAAFDSDAKVTYLSVGDEAFAEDVGAGVKEPEFMIQFIGKTVPLEVSDIDAIAGATISSTAVVNALNKAYNASQGIVEEAVEIVMPEKPAEGVFSAAEKGFAGPVYTEAAFDADGKITYIAVGDDSFAETEGFGARALAPENLYPFIGAQMPLNVEDVDALSGATFTKTAIVNSLNKAYAASKGEAVEEPTKEEAPAAETEKPETTFTAEAEGFASPVLVEAAFDGDKVTYMSIGDKRFDETPGFGARALEPEVAAAFIGKTVPLKVEDIDALTGATFTKTAVVEALNKAYEKSLAAAPAEEKASGYTASVQGFGGPVTVEATFDGDQIATIKIGDDQFAETPGLGARALEDEFQAQFIGKQMPIALSDIDAIAGATVTSTAVVDALNKAYEQAQPAAPTEEPAAEPEPKAAEAEVYTAEINSGNAVLKIEVSVADGTITALKVTPSNKEAALQEKFVGAALPLSVAETDPDLFSAAVAIDKACGVEAAPPAGTAFVKPEKPADYTEEAIASSTALKITAGFEDGKLTALTIEPADIEAAMQEKFLGAEMPVSVDQPDSDSLTVAVALNKAYSRFLAEQPEAAVAAEPEKEPAQPEVKPEDNDGFITVETISFFTEIQVKAAFEDGKVSDLAIAEKPVGSEGGYVPSAQEAEMKALFIAQALPLEVDAKLSPYAAAVAAAVNQAYGSAETDKAEEPAAVPVEEKPEEPAAVPAQEKAAASELALRVTAEFENDALTSLTVLEKADSGEFVPSAQEDALREKFIGQPLPLDIKQSSALEATAAIAINKAYYNAVHEADAQQAEIIGGADKPTAIEAGEDSEEEPILVGEAISFFTAIRATFRITPDLTIEAVAFDDKAVGAEEYQPSSRNEELEALFVGEALPLDVKAYDDPYQAAAAIAINTAFENSPYLIAYNFNSTTISTGASISFFTEYTVAAAFTGDTLVTFGAFKTPVGNIEAAEKVDCSALNLLLDGLHMPLTIGDATAAGVPEYEMTAIVIALNQAYENSLAGLQ